MSIEYEHVEFIDGERLMVDVDDISLAFANACMSNPPESDYPHERKIPDNVLFHPKRAQMDVSPVDVLRGAFDAELTDVVVVGRRPDGREYVSASSSDSAEIIYYLSRGMNLMHSHMDTKQAELLLGKADGDDDDPPAA